MMKRNRRIMGYLEISLEAFLELETFLVTGTLEEKIVNEITIFINDGFRLYFKFKFLLISNTIMFVLVTGSLPDN